MFRSYYSYNNGHTSQLWVSRYLMVCGGIDAVSLNKDACLSVVPGAQRLLTSGSVRGTFPHEWMGASSRFPGRRQEERTRAGRAKRVLRHRHRHRYSNLYRHVFLIWTTNWTTMRVHLRCQNLLFCFSPFSTAHVVIYTHEYIFCLW